MRCFVRPSRARRAEFRLIRMESVRGTVAIVSACDTIFSTIIRQRQRQRAVVAVVVQAVVQAAAAALRPLARGHSSLLTPDGPIRSSRLRAHRRFHGRHKMAQVALPPTRLAMALCELGWRAAMRAASRVTSQSTSCAIDGAMVSPYSTIKATGFLTSYCLA